MPAEAFDRVRNDLGKLLLTLPSGPSSQSGDGAARNGERLPATSQSISPRGLAGGRRRIGDEPALAELLGELQLPDSPDNPKRTYEPVDVCFEAVTSPRSYWTHFLDIAQRAAPFVTQNPDASADDFLELVRTRSAYSAGLRIDSPHAAAAVYCGELRDLDRYPELREFKASERAAVIQRELERFEGEFRKLESNDRAGKEDEVARQNDAFARGLPIEKGKHGFSVEFPELVPIFKARQLAMIRDLAALLDPKGLRGAPKKPAAEMTRARWKEMGKPRLNAKVCDELAKHSYPSEFKKSKPGTIARKRLRDRVGRHVRPMVRSSTTPPTT